MTKVTSRRALLISNTVSLIGHNQSIAFEDGHNWTGIFTSGDLHQPVVGHNGPQDVEDDHIEQILHQERFPILLPENKSLLYIHTVQYMK